MFVIFVIDYIFHLESAYSKLTYIFSFEGFIDFISLFGILNVFYFQHDLRFLAFFRITKIFKVLRAFRMSTLILAADDGMIPHAYEAIYFDIISLIVGIILVIADITLKVILSCLLGRLGFYLRR